MEEETKEERKAADAAIRSAKKAARPARIGIPDKPSSKQGKAKQQKKKKLALGKAGFGQDQGSRTNQREGIRAKRGDAIGKVKRRERRK